MLGFFSDAWDFLRDVAGRVDLPDLVADNVKYLVPLLSMAFMFTLGALIANMRWRQKLFPELITGFLLYERDGVLKKRTFLDGTLMSIWKESRTSRSIVERARKKTSDAWPILGFQRDANVADMIFDSICNHVSANNSQGILMEGAGVPVPTQTLIMSITHMRLTRKYLRVAGVYLATGLDLLINPDRWDDLARSEKDRRRLDVLRAMVALYVLEHEQEFRLSSEWKMLGFDDDQLAVLQDRARAALEELDPEKCTADTSLCWINAIEIAVPVVSGDFDPKPAKRPALTAPSSPLPVPPPSPKPSKASTPQRGERMLF